MALNLVEYKSPVQNVIAYARIACLLFQFGAGSRKENKAAIVAVTSRIDLLNNSRKLEEMRWSC